jgi:hypothetical protein
MPLLPETAFSLVCSKENRPDPRVANMLMCAKQALMKEEIPIRRLQWNTQYEPHSQRKKNEGSMDTKTPT